MCNLIRRGVDTRKGVHTRAYLKKVRVTNTKGGRGKMGRGKHHDVVEPLMYFTFWIELTGVSEDSFY